jgi:hypothetical protein
MRMQYTHDGTTAQIDLIAETKAEKLMLGALEPKQHALKCTAYVDTDGMYEGAPIRKITLCLKAEPLVYPEPLG